MVKALRDGKSVEKRPINKVKLFFWRLLQIFFGLLFVCSIAICVLFATGVITIVEDGESGELHLHFESPLVPKNDDRQSQNANQSNTSGNDTEQSEGFNGDNIGWGPAIDKTCEEGNSTCEKNRESLPSIAGFDLDLDGLIYNANNSHPDEDLTISDIRFTSNGRYAVAKIVSNQTKDTNVIIGELYFYRSTYNSKGWSELKGLGDAQVFNCLQLSSVQKMIIEDTYSERGCADNNNY